MEINKVIKKYGNSAVMVLSSEDLKMLDKRVGDMITFNFESEEEQNRQIERDQLIKSNQSYESYERDEKDAIERGFNRNRFIMSKSQHKKYQSHFDKKTGKIKDKEKFGKFWDKIVKEFREEIWNKKVVKK